ncbi:MAG: NAD(+) diphosphatase [Victivallales bacterium]|nr:NAD(+) diphosphatase [Victivallales bacterium]
MNAIGADAYIVLYARKTSVMADGGSRIPRASELIGHLPPETMMMFAGTIDGVECWGARLPNDFNPPAGLEAIESRLAFVHPNPDLAYAISRCRTFVSWRNAHRFCGACGTSTAFADSDLAIVCPSCGMMYYPQIAPAVITMITRNDGKEVLLAHNRRFSSPSFSLIAGFVEAGESLEQAVSREIREETGITVKNIRYLHSQPWPFPNSLMLGFQAEYESGTAFPQDGELDQMGWYSRDTLPQLPHKGSIARRILENFFGLEM